MHVALSWVLLAVAGTGAATGPIVLENASDQPFHYRLYFGFNPDQGEPWTATLTIPAGERRTIGSAVDVVVASAEGSEWKLHTLQPGNCFRYVLDEQRHGGLFLVDAPARANLKVREIKVLTVADIEYRDRFPDWKERTRDLVAAASRFYEAEFGLRFTVVACKPWEFNARYQPSLGEKLVSLQKIEIGQADLMIAFVRSAQQTTDKTLIGLGFRLCEYLIVVDTWPELADAMPPLPPACREVWRKPGFGSTATLVHELAHLLGAFHVDNRESTMYSKIGETFPPRIQFDEITRQVILATREVDFRAGPDSVPRATALKLRDLYQTHHITSEPADNDPITSAYHYRVAFALISQNFPLANRLGHRSTTWWREARLLQPAIRDANGVRGATEDTDRLDSLFGSAATAKPTLPSSSTDPVRLRYRFRVGETFPFAVEEKHTRESAAIPADGSKSGGNLRVCAKCEVDAVTDEGNAQVTIVVTGVTVGGAAPGDRSIDLARSAAAAQPGLVPLAAMINRPLAITVSSSGRVLRCDVRPLVDETRRRGGDLALRHLDWAVNLLLKNVFVRLPEDPVKAGDAYDPGDHRWSLGSGGYVHTAMSCRLAAVSADRKTALLELSSRTSYHAPGATAVKVDLDRMTAGGWVLLDLEKGRIARLARQFTSTTSISEGSKTVTTKVATQIVYTSTAEPLANPP